VNLAPRYPLRPIWFWTDSLHLKLDTEIGATNRRCAAGRIVRPRLDTVIARRQLGDPQIAGGCEHVAVRLVVVRGPDRKETSSLPSGRPRFSHGFLPLISVAHLVLDKEESSQIISGDGTYEETWVAPKRWRREVTLGSYQAIEVQAHVDSFDRRRAGTTILLFDTSP
jgi:hypothetical protein